jgi:predicted amidophosphoribosyltransferase
MIPKIVQSRMQLGEFSIWQKPDADQTVFFITAPEVYPELFYLRFPDIAEKSQHKEWRQVTNKSGKLVSFLSFEPDALSEEELEVVGEWKERFAQYVLIGLNRNIVTSFFSELDFCLALDYTFIDKYPRKVHTLYGRAIYQLKNQNNIQALGILSGGLSMALQELTLMFRTRSPVISIVPSPVDQCSVPRKLAKAVSHNTGIEFVDCSLHCSKQKLRGLSLSEKAPEWDRLYDCPECVQRSVDVEGKTVFLIDDLYQSGTTLWSCAKNLKKAGATCVVGLVCVKTWRDTDNQ